ncbi:NAD-dependent epimerase/dehydratase family protein [Lachnospiraceae bacterium C1.1]
MSQTNKMYLVTGAAGFLGSTVCRKLVDRNEKVRAFVLEGDKSAAYLPEEVEIVYGDLCNKDDLERFDSSKASKELGYTTRSYRETIRDEIRWLKETGKIACILMIKLQESAFTAGSV